MRFFSLRKSLFFDNNTLHFSKQDCITHTLLAFFILLLPLYSLLPHTRLCLALSVLLLLYISLRRGTVAIKDRALYLYILFLTAAFSGVFKRGAAVDSLLFFVLALSGFLPMLYQLSRHLLSRTLALSGGFTGAFALLEYLSGRALALWSDTERFGTLSRTGAFFGNPNILGAFLSVCVIFSFDAFLTSLKEGGFSVYALCLGFSLSGLLLSFSRGAWLGALSGFAFYLWRLFTQKKSKKERLYSFPAFLSPFLSRALSIFSPDSSMSYRFSLWKSIFSVPPLTLLCGVGEGRGALLSLLSPYMAAGLEKIEHTHSLYLHVLTAEGALGLAFLLLFLFFRFRKKEGNAAADGALLSIMLYGIFDDPLYSGQLGVIFWILANVN